MAYVRVYLFGVLGGVEALVYIIDGENSNIGNGGERKFTDRPSQHQATMRQ